MPTFTTQQQEAVDARGTDLLVSAAAGSGKTTVLVARVLALLEEGMDIERVLIVTFTRAAAADMRAKLQKRLEELAGKSERFLDQLDRLPLASIGTLHSFCSSLMRECFETAGVDPTFRIMEGAEADRMQANALREAMDEVYAGGGEGVEWLTCGRNAHAVAELAGSLYRFARNRPDPWEWLENAVENCDSEDSVRRCMEILEQDAKASLREAADLYAEALRICTLQDGPEHYAPAIQSDALWVDEVLGLTGEALYERLRAFSQTRPGRGKCDANLLEKVKTLRDSAKKSVEKAGSALGNVARAKEDMALAKPAMRTLAQIVRALHSRLEAEKDERGIYDYADLEQRALRVLNDEGVAKAISQRYDAVFVDEYQDVSDIQEAIVRKVAREGCLFLVGDVKQSIYRFRLAEPSLFLARQKAFSKEQGGRLIRLNRNFRSRTRILEFTNRVFEKALGCEGSEISYTQEEYLYPGASWPDADPPVEIAVLPTREEKDEEEGLDASDAATREGMFIAKRIRELVGTPLYDAAVGGMRPLRYRDIVILARTRSRLLPLREVLEAEDIPCFADTGGGYAESMEIRHVLAMLALVNNARRDNDLLAMLLSPCFGFSPEDIAKIRIACPKDSFRNAALKKSEAEDELGLRLREFFAGLQRWRMLARNLPLDMFIDRFLRESGFAAYVGALAGGERRQANLDLLCAMAAQWSETHTGGLSGFLESFKMPGGGAADYGEAQPLGEGDDVVRLMTAHKSKGLEFPVVFGVQTERDYTKKPTRGELCMHRKLGFGIELHDPNLGTKRDTVLMQAVRSLENLETVNEEMRLLYVLMTRASDRLILVGRTSDMNASRRRWNALAGSERHGDVRRLRSWLDVIASGVPGLVQEGEEGKEEGIVLHLSAPDGVPGAHRPSDPKVSPTEVLDRALREGQNGASEVLDSAYAWVYPYAEETISPLKITVTSVARQVQGPIEYQKPEELPEFLGGTSRRMLERGTVTHVALCELDFAALRGVQGSELEERVRNQLDALTQRGRLVQDERDLLRVDMLLRFLSSDLGRRAIAADVLQREWAFHLRMHTKEVFGENAPDTFVLVQGVIDCCFLENGKWVLLDYKTDAAKDEGELLERYAPQLRMYRYALEEITGIPVAESRLCLLRTGRAIAVE